MVLSEICFIITFIFKLCYSYVHTDKEQGKVLKTITKMVLLMLLLNVQQIQHCVIPIKRYSCIWQKSTCLILVPLIS